MNNGPVHYTSGSESSGYPNELLVDFSNLAYSKVKRFKKDKFEFFFNEIVIKAIDLIFEDGMNEKYENFIIIIHEKLLKEGINCPIDFINEVLYPIKTDFIPYIKRTTDLIKILYDLGYSDPDVETMDIVFEAYKKYQKKTNIKDWKIAFRLQVNHDGKGFQSKQDVLTEIRKMKLNWTETKINIFLMKHFYIPKVKTELAKNYSIKYYEKSELKKVDEKYKSKPKDLKELLHRIESNNIEISDSMLTYLSQWIYNIRGAPAHIRKKKLKKVHDEIVTHIGRDPVDELEVEYIAHELDITTEIAMETARTFFGMKSTSLLDLIELKCLAIKDHLGRLPKNKDEIVSSGKEICIFIGDESIDNIWNSFENMKEPVDKVYDYFNNTDKKFSFFSLPYSEDEIIEGLHRWIDTMDVSDKERYYLLRNRLVPNDIITDILNM